MNHFASLDNESFRIFQDQQSSISHPLNSNCKTVLTSVAIHV